MRISGLHSGFTIFVLFFGASLLETLWTGNWLLAAFWLAIGTMFVVVDGRRKIANL